MKHSPAMIADTRRKKLLAIGSWFLAFPFAMPAHPGHALHDAGPGHLLTSPDHLAVLALGGVALWFTARCLKRRLPRLLLRSAGVILIGAAAILWGVRA